MPKNFADWLTNELQQRKWSNSELRRRSGNAPGMATSTISMIISGKSNPGWDFCAGVAKALGEPPEKVFRLAGLLPSAPDYNDPLVKEVVNLLSSLSPQSRREILGYIQYRYDQEQNSKKRK